MKTQHLETWSGLGLLRVWGSEGEEFWLLGLRDYGLGQIWASETWLKGRVWVGNWSEGYWDCIWVVTMVGWGNTDQGLGIRVWVRVNNQEFGKG